MLQMRVELQLLHLIDSQCNSLLQGRRQREGILRVVAAGQLRVGERLHGPVRDKLRGLQRRAEAVPQELCPLVHGLPQEISLCSGRRCCCAVRGSKIVASYK